MIIPSYVLIEDVNFFGTPIPKGAIYRTTASDRDWYTPTFVDRGILTVFYGLALHFTVVKGNKYFIKIWI